MSTTQPFHWLNFSCILAFNSLNHNTRYPLGGNGYHEGNFQPYSYLGDIPGQGLFEFFPQGVLGDENANYDAVSSPIEPFLSFVA